MLKIYETHSLFQINHQKWERCGVGGYCCKGESKVKKELVLLDKCSFEDAMLKILDNQSHFDGVYADMTMFLHRPFIEAGCGFFRSEYTRFFAKDVRSFSYKVIYEEMEDVTIEWIIQHLSAERAIQYFKERGMTVCPINPR